ncbi:MAG TPA: DUF6206 family protein [Acidimicrobiia bacterium]|nr:DUF6206 family protein [Acidimicrobiia bacterium]
MIDHATLSSVEHDVTTALARNDPSGLRILGYGEISLVVGWPLDTPQWACKRLPPFRSPDEADTFRDTLDRYVAELARRGVSVVDTEVMTVPTTADELAVYCVQPVLPTPSLGVQVLRDDPERGASLLEKIVATVLDVVDERVGLDAQLSNWAWADGRLQYFDVTTPLLRRPDGTTELPTDVFLASLPWPARAGVRRFVLPGIIERYHHPRSVVLDLAANLIKEHLDGGIPTVLATAGDRLDPPLTVEEIRRDYRSDARTWQLIQAARRADRAWQTHVRRRTYPFLLPEHIER